MTASGRVLSARDFTVAGRSSDPLGGIRGAKLKEDDCHEKLSLRCLRTG